MKTKQEILAELPNFYGTEHYHRFSPLFRNFVLTDGAKYIAEECGAYWLMDAIASYKQKYQAEGFAVATLTASHDSGTLVITDGNGNTFAQQDIGFTDFPLDEITLYVIDNGDFWVLLLPSEY